MLQDLLFLWLFINCLGLLITIIEFTDFAKYHNGLHKYSDYFKINLELTIGKIVVAILFFPYHLGITIIATIIITSKVKLKDIVRLFKK
jgi:hypothetical protein